MNENNRYYGWGCRQEHLYDDKFVNCDLSICYLYNHSDDHYGFFIEENRTFITYEYGDGTSYGDGTGDGFYREFI